MEKYNYVSVLVLMAGEDVALFKLLWGAMGEILVVSVFVKHVLFLDLHMLCPKNAAPLLTTKLNLKLAILAFDSFRVRTWFCEIDQDFWLSKIGIAMVKDSLSSPHRRTQNSLSSPSYKKHSQLRDELGSWSTLFERHRFLLTALALLVFLCTVYLYFAVTMGASGTCSGLTGKEKASCHLEHAKSTGNGKLKFF
ncbi:hypothetical protein RJ641_023240 [Dillenia turbinata]|uniref:Uncharacterized protein n=1 Tax=Dillenia turbinata TaxID=194707 RepID=A0AAN8YSK1_9MAGN